MSEETVSEELLAERKSWQSRFDKLLKEKKELEQALSEKEEVSASRRKETDAVDRRERIFNSAIDRGMDPRVALSIILGEDDDERLDLFVSAVAKGVADGVDREVTERFKHSAKPQADLQPYIPSWQKLTQMSEADLARFSPQEISAIATKQEVSDRSVRSKVSATMSGTGLDV